ARSPASLDLDSLVEGGPATKDLHPRCARVPVAAAPGPRSKCITASQGYRRAMEVSRSGSHLPAGEGSGGGGAKEKASGRGARKKGPPGGNPLVGRWIRRDTMVTPGIVGGSIRFLESR